MEARKIIITGGATRIGAAIAEKLSGPNKEITIHYNQSKSKAERLKKTLQKIFKFQVSDKERKARSNIIIYNNDTKKDFIFSLEKALIKLLKWEKL